MRSPLLYGLLAVAGLVIIAILGFGTLTVDGRRHSQYVMQLRQFREVDVMLNQDILKVRQGLLTYYDPIVNGIKKRQRLQYDLSQMPTYIGQLAQTRFAQLLRNSKNLTTRKSALVNDFISQHAIFKNSLAYFPMIVDEFAHSLSSDPDLIEQSQTLQRLFREILLCSLTESDAALQALIGQRIEALRRYPVRTVPIHAPNQEARWDLMLDHAQNILNSKSQVDRLLKAMMAIPARTSDTALIYSYDRSYHQALTVSNRYRLGLFLAVMITIGGIASGMIITLRRSAEALEQAKTSADAANRAKSQFLASINHELRSPLNAIIGFIQILLRDTSLTPTQCERLDIINRNSEHLLGLINDVLAVSQIEAGRITLSEQAFDVDHLCHTLEQLLSMRATDKNLQFLVQADPDIPQHVIADEGKLRQVLVNLVGNAIKFTQTGRVSVHVGYQDERLIFSVHDTGPGITDDELEVLFEPFVQAQAGQRAQQGTGLGLSISREYVRLMGGDITIDSAVDEGTTFQFDIQVRLASSDEVRPQPQPHQVIGLAAGQPACRILIVEDRWSNRTLLVQLLRPLGFEVREATNGEEGLEVWEQWQPHLILMDMRMPKLDGYDTTRRIKAHETGPNTVIIALTASTFEEERANILAVGCDDYLRKPVAPAVLLDKLSEHLSLDYVYENPAEISRAPSSSPQADALLFGLRQMPKDWTGELEQAAISADAEWIATLSATIPADHIDLRDGLQHYVDHFRFDKITALTQRVTHE